MPIFPKNCVYCFEPTEGYKTISVSASEVTGFTILYTKVTYRHGEIKLPMCMSCVVKLWDSDKKGYRGSRRPSPDGKIEFPTKENWGKLLGNGNLKFNNHKFQEAYEKLNNEKNLFEVF